MKKLLILSVSLLLLSCKPDIKPIDIYKNKGIVVIEEPCSLPPAYLNNSKIRCKTIDSIFHIKISDFDAKDLKVGDTIK